MSDNGVALGRRLDFRPLLAIEGVEGGIPIEESRRRPAADVLRELGVAGLVLAVAIRADQTAVKQVIPCSSAEVAEAAKILENTYRAVNIALVNEMKLVLDAMGIDMQKVRKGTWRGRPHAYRGPPPPADGLKTILVVQSPRGGRVLAVAKAKS